MNSFSKPFAEVRHIATDVLIIGSGIAGMMAVVGAIRSGIKPMIATKSTYASGSSSMAREYAESLTDNEKAALYPEAAQKGMAEMSEKFRQMGEQVYVEADAVKASNKAL